MNPTITHPKTVSASGSFESLARGCQSTVFARRVIPDLSDTALSILDAELNDDIDQQIQEALDVGSREFLARAALFDEKDKLLDGQFGARGMDTGDRPGVSAIDVAQIVERLLPAQ